MTSRWTRQQRRARPIGVLLLIGLACGLLAPGIGDASAQEPPRPTLRVLKSQYYRIHTDVDAALAEDLSRRMDAMYDEYRRRLVDFGQVTDDRALEVYLFKNKKDYLAFTGNGMNFSGGVFMPRRRTLAAYLEQQGRDALRRTLQHEAFHQFAHDAIHPDMPVWLNEGIAQIFEEGLWNGRQFWVGQVPPRRVRVLQHDIKNKRLIEFRKFLAIDHKTWSDALAADPELSATQYNQAWAMAHFLIYAADGNGKPRFRERFLKLLKLTHEGKDSTTAFREAFSDNIEGFQARFMEYAAALQPTPEATMIENQSVLSDMLVEASTRGLKFRDMTEFRDAVSRGRYRHYHKIGQTTWTSEVDPAVYFRNLKGRTFDSSELFLQFRSHSPLPDIVCRTSQTLQLRSRFYHDEAAVTYEVLLEPR